MQPIGQSYDWVYADVRTGEFVCIRIAGNSCIITDLKANLEIMGDLFFPVCVDETVPECFKCGRRHGLFHGGGYEICDPCRGVYD